MSIQVQWRRGTRTQNNSFTGANGEISVDTTRKEVRVHDNSTLGGGGIVPSEQSILKNLYASGLAAGPDSAGLYTLTLDTKASAYATYMEFWFKAEGNSVGNDAINVNGWGTKTFKKNSGVDNLAADDLVAGGIYRGVYDGTYVQLNLGKEGGDLVFVDEIVLSGDSLVEIVSDDYPTLFDGTYDVIEVYFLGVKCSAGTTALYARTRVSSAYLTANYLLHGHETVVSTQYDIDPTTAAQLSLTVNSGFDSPHYADGVVRVLNPSNATYHKKIVWDLAALRSDNAAFFTTRGIGYNSASVAAIDGFKFYFSSGTMSGKLAIYTRVRV